MKARWIQIKQPVPMPGGSNFQQWVVADEDDEIIAMVSGDGQMWGAQIVASIGFGFPRSGQYLSEAAAKKAVEGWLSNTHQFYDPNATAWALRTNP